MPRTPAASPLESSLEIRDIIDDPEFNPVTNSGRGDYALRDVTEKNVVLDARWNRPRCVLHGAMNTPVPDRSIWRCLACGRACYAPAFRAAASR